MFAFLQGRVVQLLLAGLLAELAKELKTAAPGLIAKLRAMPLADQLARLRAMVMTNHPLLNKTLTFVLNYVNSGVLAAYPALLTTLEADVQKFLDTFAAPPGLSAGPRP